MADTQRKNLLRNLASAARRAQEVREMSPARALRLGLARAAAQLYELPVQVTEVKCTGLGGEEVAAACGPDMLLALLDGPDGARGAVALNRAMVAALIEVQVMGVVSTLELSDRALTPTDAAMVAPWLDAALERVDLALAEGLPEGTGPDCGKAGDWLIGYRFGAMAEDARALALALDATRFHLLRLTVDVALGRRTGEIVLLLPAADMAERRNQAEPAATAGESFLQVPAELRVVAGRLSLPLSRAGALRPGDVLPLDRLALATAELRSVDGTLAGQARLGRVGEHWAVRFGPAARPEPPAEPVADTPARSAPAGPARQVPKEQVTSLPELPPMDFDDPPEPDTAPVALDGTQELGNAGFE
ncbi:FliM/FliN family flagellar motor switch protein [Marinovum sp. SP66]|uniref:flagellar motor switch protein FliM n=1 Tax=Marinovum TaxID=367771 RepID=UPI00237B1FE8|nr:flagellar motor switch protein FliM [Marinovum sp. SP66]MDD9738663.1 FliM/FliN family flagellar motor switch protein [Marinovum sp. SP66]